MRHHLGVVSRLGWGGLVSPSAGREGVSPSRMLTGEGPTSVDLDHANNSRANGKSVCISTIGRSLGSLQSFYQPL
jgi:hypothetical protein